MIERILCISDTHCGHIAGVTPPAWWVSPKRGGDWADIAKMQRRGWRTLTGWIDELRPANGYRACLLGGDLIDGRQEKQGGRELLVVDPAKQCELAVQYAKYAAPRNGTYAMAYGTGYHTGKLRDEEDAIGDALGIPYTRRGDRLTLDIDGCIIDLAHHVNGGMAPTGGDSALRTEQVQSHEWSIIHGFPVPHVIVRGHKHRYRRLADGKPEVCVLPGQQLWTKYGAGICRGIIHFGVVAFDWDTERKEIVQWHARLLPLVSVKDSPVKM